RVFMGEETTLRLTRGQDARRMITYLVNLCSRTIRFLPEAMQTVCILPDCCRVSGQTMKSPKTSLSQSSLFLISTGKIVGPGAFDTSLGSNIPSNLFVRIGHKRMLGVPL